MSNRIAFKKKFKRISYTLVSQNKNMSWCDARVDQSKHATSLKFTRI